MSSWETHLFPRRWGPNPPAAIFPVYTVCNIHTAYTLESHHSQSVNGHNLDTQNLSLLGHSQIPRFPPDFYVFPNFLIFFLIFGIFANSLCFPWFFLYFPKFPEFSLISFCVFPYSLSFPWKNRNIFSRSFLISRVAETPVFDTTLVWGSVSSVVCDSRTLIIKNINSKIITRGSVHLPLVAISEWGGSCITSAASTT